MDVINECLAIQIVIYDPLEFVCGFYFCVHYTICLHSYVHVLQLRSLQNKVTRTHKMAARYTNTKIHVRNILDYNYILR